MSEIDILDVRGLNCPLPVLKAKKAMKAIEKGAMLWVETTDPLASVDIPNFCTLDGHELLKTEPGDGFQRFLIRK